MKSYNKALGGFVVAGVMASISLASGPAFAQTLRDALAAAYTNNPELLSQRETLRSTIEGVPQALSNWRPSVTLSGDYSKQWSHLNTRESSGSRDQRRFPHSAGIDVTQPLYRGGRTDAAVGQAEYNVLAAKATLDGREQDTLLAAVIAFMNVVRDKALLDLRVNNEQVLNRQLSATRDRFNVGEITRTDVSQSEARLAGAVAQRVAAEGTLQNSRAAYLNVIGEAPGDLIPPTLPSDLPPSLDATLASARVNHPDVVSAQYSEQSSKENVKLVGGELLPTLSLVGSTTRLWQNTTADSQQTTSTVGLDLTVPIYEKGAVYSRLRSAKILAGRSRLDLDNVRSDTVQGASSAWESLKSARAQIQSFDSQISAAEIALEGVQREAAVGSRTVLDVLDAEQELLNARVSLVSARRDEIVAAYQLKESVGEFTAQRLDLPVNIYNPMEYYDRVRNKWWGTEPPGGTKDDQ
jgi:outer membrane protein